MSSFCFWLGFGANVITIVGNNLVHGDDPDGGRDVIVRLLHEPRRNFTCRQPAKRQARFVLEWKQARR